MDSWFDLFVRIIFFLVVISVVILLFKKNSNKNENEKWELYDDEAMLEKLGEKTADSKPSGPPPPGSFG